MDNLKTSTILIVDDTPENIDILVDILSDFNKTVAIDGEDALETIFENELPDLILLDIMMPKLDGFEVCKYLRLHEKTKEIPIIFLTAKTNEEDIIQAFESGGQDYVAKPFYPSELLALPADEKLRLVEMLWDNLGESTEPIPLPGWVAEEAARRRD